MEGSGGMFSQACGPAHYTRPTDRDYDETGGIVLLFKESVDNWWVLFI